MMGTDWLGNCSAEKALRVLGHSRLHVSAAFLG